MTTANFIKIRERILHTHVKISTWSGGMIAKVLKFIKSTAYTMCKRYREILKLDRAKQNKRISETYDRKLQTKIIRAKKFNASHSTVRRICMREGLRPHHTGKHPNRTLQPNQVAKTRARKLYEQVLIKYNRCILMDGEARMKR